jgi:hypothetical protein
MSAMGAHQYEIDHRLHLEYFYHGNIYTAHSTVHDLLPERSFVCLHEFALAISVLRHHRVPSS